MQATTNVQQGLQHILSCTASDVAALGSLLNEEGMTYINLYTPTNLHTNGKRFHLVARPDVGDAKHELQVAVPARHNC